MSAVPTDLTAARRQAAARRRSEGVALDFDASRLALARRLAGIQRSKLARAIGVTAAAISQYERGQTKPTLPAVGAMAEALDVPADFFRAGHAIAPLLAAGAHFRSLRSTTSLERERALASAELVLALIGVLEQYVDLPDLDLPALDVPPTLTPPDIRSLAGATRTHFGVSDGPIPNVVRLLEAHGVFVATLWANSDQVDAFCHQQGPRPIVLLNQSKNDKARGRFDSAHELGHLVMHHDVDPGLRIVEQQAHQFAAEFLTPADEVIDELPDRLDWVVFHRLKRRWGVSLKSLVYRAHELGRLTDHGYQQGMRQLALWGYPERGPLGPPEPPALLGRALPLVDGDVTFEDLARDAGIPAGLAIQVAEACGLTTRPKLLPL